MELKKAIFERRTIHLFDSSKVSEEIIEESIIAANQAPCHKLTFPWRFYSIGKEKRNEILKLAIEIKSEKALLDEHSLNLLRKKYLNPSHLLIASQVLNIDQVIKKEDYAACSCAIQNLSLSLVSNGVSTKWSTGSLTNNSKVYQITKIDPCLEEIIGFIWVGYGENSSKISRPPLSKIYKNI